MFVPKLVETIKVYNTQKLVQDLVAGLIVAIIALPLSIALAIASGVSPEKGLITAIIGGFVAAAVGGSRYQVSGPTGAFVVIVLGIIQEFGVNGLIAATFMAGVMLIAMGFMKMGDLIKFIPHPITTGFTCGIAVTIFSTQVEDFLGLQIEGLPSEFIEKWMTYFEHLGQTQWMALIIGLVTVVIIQLWPKVNAKIPGTLIAILATTAVVTIFKIDVATIGTQFEDIKGSIPAPSFPGDLSFDMLKKLFPAAFAIAFLGSIESLLSAVVADGMTGRNHKSNIELIGQGCGNIASAFFGGIPVTGAIARTAANIKNGARTPMAGMFHSVFLLIMMIFLMPYVKYIPMATLAGILMVVAYNMGEWEYFKMIPKSPKSDSLVFLTTFFLTVIFDLVIAIEVGMVMAAFLFMKRMADVAQFNLTPPEQIDSDVRPIAAEGKRSEIMVYAINGPFFFGAADQFVKNYQTQQKSPKVLILDLTLVPFIDATGFSALSRVHKICKAHKTKLLLCGLQEKTEKTLGKFGFLDKLGEGRIYKTMQLARGRAEAMVAQDKKTIKKDTV